MKSRAVRRPIARAGVCPNCDGGCQGNCDVFQASIRGGEAIRPGAAWQPLPEDDLPVDYSHLWIRGHGAVRPEEPLAAGSGRNTPPVVSVAVEYGWDHKVRMAAPVFAALRAGEELPEDGEELAIGAALGGVTLVCGEVFPGGDPQLQRDDLGRSRLAELDRWIESYRRYHRGLGEILVQVNVEDRRLGLAEYLIDKHGLDAVELKLGGKRKSIGKEIQVPSWEQAIELRRRGFVVTPDPSDPMVKSLYDDGAIAHFERHCSPGFVDEAGFVAERDRLGQLGFRRVTLHCAASGLRELAIAIRWGSKAKLDLVTIEGGSHAAMSWPAADDDGMPNVYLHAATAEFAARLASRGERVPDLALSGGFSTEQQVFKSLALASPFVKAAGMGRALAIPGAVGKNVGLWMESGNLPASVSQHGTSAEEIFACWDELAELVGKDEIRRIPLGAIGVYSYLQKLRVGLRDLMAGAGRFSVTSIARNDLASLTRRSAEVTKIPYFADAYRDEAEAILDA